MFKKYKYSFIIVLLILSLLAFFYAISNKKTYADDLNQSLKNVIEDTDNNYNYMEDAYFIDKLNDLVKFTYKDVSLSDEHYTIGDLDGDNIPEIVVFRQRDPKDLSDEGSLDIYKYKNDKYVLIDSISMNYDNTCYDLKIGNISKDIKGIYLSNQVGAHSGLTYGYILKNDKLINILNPNKLNLLSVYTDNEIKDIDNDGILNFGVYTIDPEDSDKSVSESQKLTLWYEWNESDSANLIAVEKNGKIQKERIVHKTLFNKGIELLSDDTSSFIPYLDANLDNFDKAEVSILLTRYLKILSNKISTFNSQGELKEINFISNDDFLINNINQGSLIQADNTSKLCVNYAYFSKKYKEYTSSEFSDLVDIVSIKLNTITENSEYLDLLSQRIVKIENFKTIYPYSEFIDDLNKVYLHDINSLLFENDKALNFTVDNRITSTGLKKLNKFKDLYPNTTLANAITTLIDELNNNDLIINDEIRENIIVSFK